MTRRNLAVGVIAALAATSAYAADADQGQSVFKQQCANCHVTESRTPPGALGPSLYKIFGRKAASNAAFTYSDALRRSALVWDEITLDRFLASPVLSVPGSSMVTALRNTEDRANVVSFLTTLGRRSSGRSVTLNPARLAKGDDTDPYQYTP
ncbi:MAG: c-type cytochrome [Steroidobacteraceae bacterium]